MKKRYAVLLCGVLLIAVLCTASACSRSNSGPVKKAGIVSFEGKLSSQSISPFPEDFVSGTNQFGWTAVSKLFTQDNIAISPASLELAILMTRSGADGATADEIRDALSLSGMTDDQILAACQQLMWRTNTNGMEDANSIWMQKDYMFSDRFVQTCTDTFMADANVVDFQRASKDATDQINQWASDKTHGKIAKMNPSPLPDDTRMVLVNALYFLGDWETPFIAQNTSDQTFHGTKSDADVPFMHDQRSMLYSKTSAYQMISLPFKGAKGEADSPFSMAFILPAEGQDITAVMNSLAVDGFSGVCSNLNNAEVNLSLPKFTFTYDTSMVKTMESLGMKLAFDPVQAQFDGMTGSSNDLYISDILHKCYIRVDEKGAEAAAVTEVTMADTAMPVQEDIKNFTADRPFLFAIYDETDNTILFLGAVGQL